MSRTGSRIFNVDALWSPAGIPGPIRAERAVEADGEDTRGPGIQFRSDGAPLLVISLIIITAIPQQGLSAPAVGWLWIGLIDDFRSMIFEV